MDTASGSDARAGYDRQVDPTPIVRGDGERGVLVLHGLTGTPWEVAPVAHALADLGYAVRAPLIAGHDRLEALEGSTWRQWYASAEAELDRLRDGGRRKVVIAGFSMGSLLTLRMAALRPRDMVGIVGMAVPLELPAWTRPVIRAAAHLRGRPRLRTLIGMLPKIGGPDIRIEREVSRSPSLHAFPYPALAQFLLLQREVEELLPLVRAPLLLVHGRYDHTAPARLSLRVAQRVASDRVQRVELPRSFHIIAHDLDRDRAIAEVTTFVRSILPPPETA